MNPTVPSELNAKTDLVTDFHGINKTDSQGNDLSQGDRLDLRGLADHSSLPTGTKLTFIGTNAFSGTKQVYSGAGSVRYWQDDKAGTANDVTHVLVDLDGNGNADFQVDLTGLHTLGDADLLLA